MLKLQDVSLFVGRGDNIHPILADVDIQLPDQHFVAIIGPSGCGKTSLLKAIAGIAEGDEEGTFSWRDRNLDEEDFEPFEIGYVPQFSIAHDELTAFECVEFAARLKTRGSASSIRQRSGEVLAEVGLAEFSDRRVAVLSGGQKRRLALAMEIVSAPAILLCDEVTSGLDAQSESEITYLLRSLASHGRLVVSVTHSLRHIELYDSIIVMSQGSLAFHGKPADLLHYFQLEDTESLYATLLMRDGKEWSESWKKHRTPYLSEILHGPVLLTPDEAFAPEPAEHYPIEGSEGIPAADESEALHEIEVTAPVADDLVAMESVDDPSIAEYDAHPSEAHPSDDHAVAGRVEPPKQRLPGPFSQFSTLLNRRLVIFSRSAGQLLLQAGLILGFPFLVAIFAWNGLPQVQNLSTGLDLDAVTALAESSAFLVQASKIGSLVSGIVMFEVILLTLMGANNSGREIAAERHIFEKEKLGGVRPISYVASKSVFLGMLVIAQSVWMGLFVHFVCGFPGDLPAQLAFLILVNAAMTAICLGISAWMPTAEQASLVSIYLVGFQLPLSGAVLALPDTIGAAVRPFISAYWSWSGVLQTLRGERYYEIVQMVAQTALSPAALCLWILSAHIVTGLFLAWAGCRSMRMA